MPTQLQQNRYDQTLRRVGDLKGPGSKVNEVLSEVFPVFDLENLPSELLFLSGTKLGFGVTDQDSSPGEHSHSQLFNPTGSGKLVVLTEAIISSKEAQRIFITTSTNPLLTLVTANRQRDSRADFGQPTATQLRVDQNATAFVPIGIISLTTNEAFRLQSLNGLFIMTPGFGVRFSTEELAASLTVNYVWRERIASPSEVSF